MAEVMPPAPRLVCIETSPGETWKCYPATCADSHTEPELSDHKKRLYRIFERFVDHTTGDALVTLCSAAIPNSQLGSLLSCGHPIAVAFHKRVSEMHPEYGQLTRWKNKAEWIMERRDALFGKGCELFVHIKRRDDWSPSSTVSEELFQVRKRKWLAQPKGSNSATVRVVGASMTR